MAYSIGFFINDNDLYVKELIRFNSLKELDTFTMKKINADDIIRTFPDEIAEYIVNHKKLIKDKKGFIKSYNYDSKNNIHYIDVLYKGFRMLDYNDFVQLLRIEFKKEFIKLKNKGSRSTLDAEPFIKICKKYNIDFGSYQERVKNSLRQYAIYLREKDLDDFLGFIRLTFSKKNDDEKYLFLRNVSIINEKERIVQKKDVLNKLKTKLGLIDNINVRNREYSINRKNPYNHETEIQQELSVEDIDESLYDIEGLRL